MGLFHVKQLPLKFQKNVFVSWLKRKV